MILNRRKEEFSIAYVHAVSSMANCAVTRAVVDVNGYDLTLAATDEHNLPRLPKLDVQMKCTARDLLREAHLHFPLDVATYRKLRRETLVPRILVVMSVPTDQVRWATQTEEEMTLRHCAYWVSLLGQNETDNEETVTVYLPRTQLFTPEALRGILERVNQGENP